MKSFEHWVVDLTNSIEDASIIHKDDKGNIVPQLPEYVVCKNCDCRAHVLKEVEDPYYDWDY